MRWLSDPGAAARAAFFALLPAAAVGGAMALPVLICVAGAFCFRPSQLAQALEKRPLAIIFLLLLVVWAVASRAWSALPESSQALKLAALVPLGLMFAAAASAPSTRPLTQACGQAAVAVLIVLLAIEALGDLPLNRAAQPGVEPGELGRNLSRASVVLLAMVWAASASLLRQGGSARVGAARILLAATALLTFQFEQLASVVAFAAGLTAFALAFAAPRATLWAVTGGLAFWVVSAPFLTPLVLAQESLVDALPLSWAARVGIWDYVSPRVLDQVFIGHGIDASRAIEEQIVVRGLTMSAVPVHPHSASLQIWYELGAVGAALAALALLAAGTALSHAFARNRAGAAAAAASLACLGVIANVSFNVWAEWWQATLFVAAALVGGLFEPRRL